MKKPIIRILLSLLLVAVVAVGGTFAYLMATDSPLLNTFTLAEVETNIEESGSTSADKSAVVKNTGKSPVYVRARVVVSGIAPDLLDVKYHTSAINGETVWQDGEDGYYYYKAILQADPANPPTTTALFTGVDVDFSVGPEVTFSVDVYQESVLAPAGADAKWSLQDAKEAFNAKG